MANIDDFRAKLLGGGARANQFKVIINVPPIVGQGWDSETATFLVRAASLPAMTLGEITVPYRGRSIYIAGDRSFDTPWTTTFLNDTNFMIRTAMERWSNGINNLVNATGVTNPNQYQTDLIVVQMDRDDQPLKTYIFRNAWPTEVGSIELTSEAADAIEEFDVTWRYQHFEPTDVVAGAAGRPATGAGATIAPPGVIAAGR